MEKANKARPRIKMTSLTFNLTQLHSEHKCCLCLIFQLNKYFAQMIPIETKIANILTLKEPLEFHAKSVKLKYKNAKR